MGDQGNYLDVIDGGFLFFPLIGRLGKNMLRNGKSRSVAQICKLAKFLGYLLGMVYEGIRQYFLL